MKFLKQFSPLCFIALLLLFSASCNSEQTNSEELAMEVTDEQPSSITRATKKKVESKAYYYKSLASFAHGKAEVDLKDMAELQGKQVNLMVLYESIAPWANAFDGGDYSKTGNDTFNGLMESYELTITQQFVIDENNEGVVLESSKVLENAIEVAKELSLVDNVLMVHIKEVPDAPNAETVSDAASNH